VIFCNAGFLVADSPQSIFRLEVSPLIVIFLFIILTTFIDPWPWSIVREEKQSIFHDYIDVGEWPDRWLIADWLKLFSGQASHFPTLLTLQGMGGITTFRYSRTTLILGDRWLEICTGSHRYSRHSTISPIQAHWWYLSPIDRHSWRAHSPLIRCHSLSRQVLDGDFIPFGTYIHWCELLCVSILSHSLCSLMIHSLLMMPMTHWKLPTTTIHSLYSDPFSLDAIDMYSLSPLPGLPPAFHLLG